MDVSVSPQNFQKARMPIFSQICEKIGMRAFWKFWGDTLTSIALVQISCPLYEFVLSNECAVIFPSRGIVGGADIHSVQELFGHSDVRMDLRMISPTRLKAAFQEGIILILRAVRKASGIKTRASPEFA